MAELSEYDKYNNPSLTDTGPIKPKKTEVNKYEAYRQSQAKTSTQNVIEGRSMQEYTPTGIMSEDDNNGQVVLGQDLNETRAHHQSATENIFSGIAKGTGLMASTALSLISTLPEGIVRASVAAFDPTVSASEAFSKTYDNSSSQFWDRFNKGAEEMFPNYYSEAETKADAFSVENLTSSNFWGDKVLKNVGFTLGAMLGGGKVAKGLQLLTKVSMGARAAETTVAFRALTNAGVTPFAAAQKVGSMVPYAIDKATQVATGAIVSFGEASMEAKQVKDELVESLTAKYKAEKYKENPDWNGEIDPENSKRINDYASASGNVTMAVNMAVLTGLETFQFGKLWTRGFKEEVDRVGKIVVKDGVNDAVEDSAVKKAGKFVAGFGKNTLSEAAEEGIQTGTQAGAKDYYSRKYDKKGLTSTQDSILSVLAGMEETFGTKNGIESMLLGGITGIGSHAVSSAITRIVGGRTPSEFETATALAKRLNEAGEKIAPHLTSMVRAASINEEQEKNSGSPKPDRKKHEDLNAQLLRAFVQPYIETGSFDLLEDKLNQEYAKDEDRFKLDNGENATRKSGKEFVAKIVRDAKKLKTSWDNMQDLLPTSDPAIREKAWSIAAEIENRDERAKALDLELLGVTGVSYQNLGDKAVYLDKIQEAIDNGAVLTDIQKAKDVVVLFEDKKALVAEYKKLQTPEGIVEALIENAVKEEEKKAIVPEVKTEADKEKDAEVKAQEQAAIGNENEPVINASKQPAGDTQDDEEGESTDGLFDDDEVPSNDENEPVAETGDNPLENSDEFDDTGVPIVEQEDIDAKAAKTREVIDIRRQAGKTDAEILKEFKSKLPLVTGNAKAALEQVIKELEEAKNPNLIEASDWKMTFDNTADETNANLKQLIDKLQSWGEGAIVEFFNEKKRTGTVTLTNGLGDIIDKDGNAWSLYATIRKPGAYIKLIKSSASIVEPVDAKAAKKAQQSEKDSKDDLVSYSFIVHNKILPKDSAKGYYESLVPLTDKQLTEGILTDVPGFPGAKYLMMSGRLAVIAKVANGEYMPFYQSSEGTQGKTKGQWYPFFEYQKHGYISKYQPISGQLTGDVREQYDITKYYKSEALKKVGEYLDSLNITEAAIDRKTLLQYQSRTDIGRRITDGLRTYTHAINEDRAQFVDEIIAQEDADNKDAISASESREYSEMDWMAATGNRTTADHLEAINKKIYSILRYQNYLNNPKTTLLDGSYRLMVVTPKSSLYTKLLDKKNKEWLNTPNKDGSMNTIEPDGVITILVNTATDKIVITDAGGKILREVSQKEYEDSNADVDDAIEGAIVSKLVKEVGKKELSGYNAVSYTHFGFVNGFGDRVTKEQIDKDITKGVGKAWTDHVAKVATNRKLMTEGKIKYLKLTNVSYGAFINNDDSELSNNVDTIFEENDDINDTTKFEIFIPTTPGILSKDKVKTTTKRVGNKTFTVLVGRPYLIVNNRLYPLKTRVLNPTEITNVLKLFNLIKSKPAKTEAALLKIKQLVYIKPDYLQAILDGVWTADETREFLEKALRQIDKANLKSNAEREYGTESVNKTDFTSTEQSTYRDFLFSGDDPALTINFRPHPTTTEMIPNFMNGYLEYSPIEELDTDTSKQINKEDFYTLASAFYGSTSERLVVMSQNTDKEVFRSSVTLRDNKLYWHTQTGNKETDVSIVPLNEVEIERFNKLLAVNKIITDKFSKVVQRIKELEADPKSTFPHGTGVAAVSDASLIDKFDLNTEEIKMLRKHYGLSLYTAVSAAVEEYSDFLLGKELDDKDLIAQGVKDLKKSGNYKLIMDYHNSLFGKAEEIKVSLVGTTMQGKKIIAQKVIDYGFGGVFSDMYIAEDGSYFEHLNNGDTTSKPLVDSVRNKIDPSMFKWIEDNELLSSTITFSSIKYQLVYGFGEPIIIDSSRKVLNKETERNIDFDTAKSYFKGEGLWKTHNYSQTKAEEVKPEEKTVEKIVTVTPVTLTLAQQLAALDLNNTDEEDNDFDGPKRLAKLGGIDYKKEDIEATKKWWKNAFGDESLEVVDSLIKGNAFGQYTAAMTKLFSGAEVGTGYHEAFHKVTQEYLTPKQLKSLYDDVRKTVNPAFTDKQAEEYLAEDFRNFMLSGQKAIKGRPITNSIFRKLYNYLRTLLTGKTTPEQIYNKLAKGKFNGAKKFNVQQFTKLDRGAIKDMTHAQTRDIIESVNSHFFRRLFAGNKTPNEILGEGGQELVGKVYSKVFDSIKVAYGKIIQGTAAGIISAENFEILQEHYKLMLNIGDDGKPTTLNQNVIKAHKDYLKGLGIYLGESVGIEQENIELEKVEGENATGEAETQGRNKADFQASNEDNTLYSTPNSIKLLVMSLPALDVDGNAVSNNIGGPKLNDYKKTLNILYAQLAGLGTYEEQWDKLSTLTERFPVFRELMKRLGEPGSDKSQEQFLLEQDFRQSFHKSFSKGTTTLINEKTGAVYQVDANANKLADRIKEIWTSNLRVLAKDKDSYVETGDDGIIRLTQDFVEGGAQLVNQKNVKEMLRQLGIEFTDLSQEDIQNRYDNEIKTDDDDEYNFKENVDAIYTYIKEVLGEEDENKQFPINNLFSKQVGIKNRVDALIKLEQQYSKETVELSYLNAENKRIYAVSLNNFYSLTINHLNNSKTLAELYEKAPHLNVTSTRSSQWIKGLFDKKGNKIAGVTAYMNTQAGLKQQDDNESGRSATSLTSSDKIVQEINDALTRGTFALIRPADKAIESAIGISSYNGDKLVIPMQSIAANGFNDKKLKEVFLGYFNDELASIREFRGAKRVGANIAIYGQAVKDKDGTVIVGSEPANNFRLFADILSSKTLKTLEPYKTTDAVLPAALLAKINQETVTYLESYANDIETYLVDKKVGIPYVTDDGVQAFTGISAELTLKKGKRDAKMLEDVVKTFTVNHLIQMQEQSKMLVGDSAFYKDKIKRISAGTGTKKFAANSPSVNNWFNAFYKNTVGRVDNKVADGLVNAVIYGDVRANENNAQDYINALIAKGVDKKLAEKIMKPYFNMEEGDAQGWITLDEYREFMMRVGGAYWTSLHEKQYRYEVALEMQDTNKPLTEWMTAAIAEGNPNFYFMPIKAQYSGPQVMDGLFAPAFHKYSLAPIYYSLVKGRNMENLLTKMRRKKEGYALFGTGSKVGSPLQDDGKLPPFYNEDGSINDSDTIQQQIYYEYLGIQLDIAPKVKDKLIFGSQFRKLLFSNLFGENAKAWAKPLADEYNKLIDNQIKNEFNKLVKSLGINATLNKNGEMINFSFKGDYNKLVEKLKDSLEDKDTADNILDSLQTNEDGSLVYPIDALVNRDKIEKMLFSIVNNKVVKQKTLGNALVQLASSGFEGKGKRTVDESNYLKFYTSKGPNGVTTKMQVEIPMNDTFRPLLGKYNGDLNALNAAIEKGEVDERMLTMIGYRIPTQGLNSMDVMIIKRFMVESSGVAIILPSGVVAKSGGDYDIDKLNIFMPNIKGMLNKRKGTTNVKYAEMYSEDSSPVDLFEAYKGNKRSLSKELVAKVSEIEEKYEKKLKESMVRLEANVEKARENEKALKKTALKDLTLSDSEKVLLDTYRIEFINAERKLEFEIQQLEMADEWPMPDTSIPVLKLEKLRENYKDASKQLKVYAKEYLLEGLTQEKYDRIDKANKRSKEIGDEEKEEIGNLIINEIAEGKTIKSYDELNTKEAIQNRILEIAAKVLTHPDNFIDLVTPNTTDTLVNAADNIRWAQTGTTTPFKEWIKDNKVTQASTTRQFRFDWIMDQFDAFLGGKAALGVAATHNTHHILSQIAGVKLNTTLPFKHNTITTDRNKAVADSIINAAHTGEVVNLKTTLLEDLLEFDRDTDEDFHTDKELTGKNNIKYLKNEININGLKESLELTISTEGAIMLTEGNHRFHALKQLGYTEIPVIIKVRHSNGEYYNKMSKGKKVFLGLNLLKDFPEIDEEQLDLSKQYTQGGQKISDLISQFINAYVDVAKDPFYKSLNAGTDTVGVWMYMIRAGMDIDTISYFMTQPIILDYTNAKKFNSSILVRSLGMTREDKKVKQGKINEIENKVASLKKRIKDAEKEGEDNPLGADDTLIKTLRRDIKKAERKLTSVYNEVLDKYGVSSGQWATRDFKADNINEVLIGYIQENARVKEALSKTTKADISKLKVVSLSIQPDNVEQVLAGTKTTTIRSTKDAEKIGLKEGEVGVITFKGKNFYITHRGAQTIEEAGGKDAMLVSEGVGVEENFKFTQSKNWVNGTGELHVYDFKEVNDNSLDYSDDFRVSQTGLLQYFVKLEEQATGLTDLMQVTNSDTKSVRSFGSLEKETQKRIAVDENTELIPEGTAARIRKSTIVGSFDIGSTTTKMYKELGLYMSNDDVHGGLNQIANDFDKKLDYEKEWTKLQNDFIGYLTQKFGKTVDGKPIYTKMELLTGDNSLAKQLIELNREGLLEGNAFTEELIAQVSSYVKGLDNIKMYSRRMTAFEANVISEAFRELLENNNPRLVELGQNLAYLTIVQSGLQNSPITFTELIPHEFYGNIVKGAIESALEEGIDMGDFTARYKAKQEEPNFRVQDFGFSEEYLPKESVTGEGTKIEQPFPGVETIKDSGLTLEQSNQFIDLLSPQISTQSYVENTGKNANQMFSYGFRWAKTKSDGKAKFNSVQSRVFGPVPNQAKITSNSKDGKYGYFSTDQNNNPLPALNTLQPIIDFIESKLGIDMSNYDSMLANIYDEKSFINQHRDTTESQSAEKYPVIVLNLGADGRLVYDTDLSSSYTTFEDKFKSGEYGKSIHDLNLSNGSVYAFGVNGKNRFSFHHRIFSGLDTKNPLKSITLPDGTILKDYRITLTFRRAQDIAGDISTEPTRTTISNTPQVSDEQKELDGQLPQQSDSNVEMYTTESISTPDINNTEEVTLPDNIKSIQKARNQVINLQAELYREGGLRTKISELVGRMYKSTNEAQREAIQKEAKPLEERKVYIEREIARLNSELNDLKEGVYPWTEKGIAQYAEDTKTDFARFKIDNQQKSVSAVTEDVKLFNPNDKELKRGSVVTYNKNKYILWNIKSDGKAQLINYETGVKFTGTPNVSKLAAEGAYKTVEFNSIQYIVVAEDFIYSTASGDLVYAGNDNSSKVQRGRIFALTQEVTIKPIKIGQQQKDIRTINNISNRAGEEGEQQTTCKL